jgi:hypothetical protein
MARTADRAGRAATLPFATRSRAVLSRGLEPSSGRMTELLNDKQFAVLRLVAAGCPNGVMQGESHKVSAAALRSRGLVRTSGRGPRRGLSSPSKAALISQPSCNLDTLAIRAT